MRPLEGIRVLEVANWLAAPATAALMADLGADVVKVEPPGGDVYRGTEQWPYAFQNDNRGKRSVTVALDRPGGPELVRRLASKVDVYITNLLPKRQAKYGLTFDDVRAVNPRIVYGALSGYGSRGPLSDAAGFDYSAFWASSGTMSLMIGDRDGAPAASRPGQGDHTTSMNMLAAILAGLRLRDVSGEAQFVETSLQLSGVWALSSEISEVLNTGEQPPLHDHEEPGSPVWNHYRCKDGKWLIIAVLVPEPYYWPAFCRVLGRREWGEDERYNSIPARAAVSRELTAQIAAIFASDDRDTWAERLNAEGIIWAPVAELPEVTRSEQLRAMEAFKEVGHPELGRFQTVNTPFRIRGSGIGPEKAAPLPGEHTAAVLAEAGLDDGEVAQLAVDGVIG